jgi:hypothetical protein
MISGCIRAHQGTVRYGCDVIKKFVPARCPWSAAQQGTIRRIRFIGKIRIPLVLLAAAAAVQIHQRENAFPGICRMNLLNEKQIPRFARDDI